MNTTRANQRNFSRVPFQAHVRIVGEHASAETGLLDISLKGALFERPIGWSLRTGTPLTLDLLLDQEDQIRIRMHVRVAHAEGSRVGVRCEHIDLSSITHLRRLVELNLGDPALLDRDLAALG